MSSAARKKSIISSTGVDLPVANNTLLNKAAAQSTSLYQECAALRARLVRVVHFSPYFTLASSDDPRQSRDPVTQIWDVFTLGISLVYLFNLIPHSSPKIALDTSIVNFDKSQDKHKKRAIIQFSIRMQEFPSAEPFTVTDLWDRSSTDGLVKVVHNVARVVDMLPPDCFEQEPVTPSTSFSSQTSTDTLVESTLSTSLDAKETARNNIIREMVETERKYVQDLEIMQKYSVALSQSNLVDQDTIHYLFPNLNKLLNFQRKFLIRMEGIGDLPWPEQRWGSLFAQSEEEFIVYEPYCAHYTKATELMLNIETILMDLSQSIGMTAMKGELPAFLIKPIQRVCKYPLLIESLVKAANPADYPHYDELQSGLISVRRIADRINEAQRRAENEMTVKSLHARVEDWKGHHLSNFGELLVDDVFTVTKSEVDREYHVFLFEKIILCCKEAIPPPNSSKKVGRSNSSILKKQQQAAVTSPTLGGSAAANKKTTPLLLKGRIFLNNVTKAVPGSPTGSPPHYPLAVWWRGDDDLEFFTLRCRSQDSMNKWEAHITRLIEEAAKRRISDLRSNSISKVATTLNNSTHPSLGRQMPSHDRNLSHSSHMSPISQRGRRTPFGDDMQSTVSSSSSSFSRGPSHYPDHYENEEEDYEDYPPSSNYAESGRGTPVGNRRNNNALSMPPERDPHPTYERSRAQTEDMNGAVMSQWRNHHAAMPPPPPPAAGYATSNVRPTTPRLTSTASNASYVPSDASGRRPALRSQFSSTRLKSTYDESRSQPASTNGHTPARSRSASQPSAYVPKSIPPPLPTTHWPGRPDTSMSTNKRESGSSESTENSSDYSPNSSSPITPFGASDVSLGGGVGIRSSRSQHFDNVLNGASHLHYTPPIKVKVHFNEDIFVIQVPRTTEFEDLVDKVGRKIRLCGPRRDDGPLRVKYRDEDGDMISLGSTEDVQMAFEQFRPGGQVILFVS